jgi:hypothetical protein
MFFTFSPISPKQDEHPKKYTLNMQKAISILALASALLGGFHLEATDLPDPELQAILDRYTQAMGGRASLERIDSIRIRGYSTTSSGDIHQISVIKKRPNLVRISINLSGMDLTMAYDGKEAWQMVERPSRSTVQKLPPAEAAKFQREGVITSLLLQGPPIVESVQLIGSERFAGVDCHVLQVNFAEGGFTHYFIDKINYVERKIVEYPTGDLNLEGHTHIPSDYRMVEGVKVAFRTLRRSEGKPQAETVIQSVEINPGVINRFFQYPAHLE